MTKLEWGKSGSRLFETGIDRGVLYPRVGPAAPWIGLTGLEEDFSEDTSDPLYFDGVKTRDIESIGDFGGTLSAFIYPDAFEDLRGVKVVAPGLYADGQAPQQFDLSYRTLLGNDLEGERFGYRIHLVYNLVVVPAARSRETNTQETSLSMFEWEIAAVPENIPGYRPTAHLILDSTRMSFAALRDFETLLYGNENLEPSMPRPADLLGFQASRHVITEPLGAII